MTSALQRLRQFDHAAGGEDRYKLSSEVDAILDRSVGLDGYARDDVLKQKPSQAFPKSAWKHGRNGPSVGARVVFVDPASNLKDCSPFKSQDTAGISDAAVHRSWELLTMSKPLAWEKQWEIVLQFPRSGDRAQSRFADLHYRRGQAFFALGRFDEAKRELITARDEDVCPLRALTPIGQIVAEVAREQQVMLVDFEELLEKRMLSAEKHSILGEEFFLDHVHPTIEGHKLLAVALLETMSRPGLVHPGPDWRDRAASEGLGKHRRWESTRRNRVRHWPTSRECCYGRAKTMMLPVSPSRPLTSAANYREVADNAATSLATAYIRNGQPKTAVKLLYKYLEKSPDSIELRLKLGQLQLDHRDREEAAANFLLVSHQMPYYDWAHALFGIDMAERGRPEDCLLQLDGGVTTEPEQYRRQPESWLKSGPCLRARNSTRSRRSSNWIATRPVPRAGWSKDGSMPVEPSSRMVSK